jgi:hypothetical protein
LENKTWNKTKNKRKKTIQKNKKMSFAAVIPEMRHPYQIKNLRFYQEHDCHGYAHFLHKRVISTISIMCLSRAFIFCY